MPIESTEAAISKELDLYKAIAQQHPDTNLVLSLSGKENRSVQIVPSCDKENVQHQTVIKHFRDCLLKKYGELVTDWAATTLLKQATTSGLKGVTVLAIMNRAHLSARVAQATTLTSKEKASLIQTMREEIDHYTQLTTSSALQAFQLANESLHGTQYAEELLKIRQDAAAFAAAKESLKDRTPATELYDYLFLYDIAQSSAWRANRLLEAIQHPGAYRVDPDTLEHTLIFPQLTPSNTPLPRSEDLPHATAEWATTTQKNTPEATDAVALDNNTIIASAEQLSHQETLSPLAVEKNNTMASLRKSASAKAAPFIKQLKNLQSDFFVATKKAETIFQQASQANKETLKAQLEAARIIGNFPYSTQEAAKKLQELSHQDKNSVNATLILKADSLANSLASFKNQLLEAEAEAQKMVTQLRETTQEALTKAATYTIIANNEAAAREESNEGLSVEEFAEHYVQDEQNKNLQNLTRQSLHLIEQYEISLRKRTKMSQ